MSGIVSAAASYLPTPIRAEAVEIAYLSAAGYGAVEIGARLGISWRAVNSIRTQHGVAVVECLRADGYRDSEIKSLLGLPSALPPASANGSAGRKSDHG